MYNMIIVEDEKSIRENLQKGILWEKYGFHIVAEAANGEEALEKIEKLHPDVLLTDIKMPFMDGLELARIVHSLYSNIKIVIISGYTEFTYTKLFSSVWQNRGYSGIHRKVYSQLQSEFIKFFVVLFLLSSADDCNMYENSRTVRGQFVRCICEYNRY